MKNLFERASSYWVRYDRYELKEDGAGLLYITPASDAKPAVYNSLKDPEQMVLDALNVGMLCMGRKSEAVIRQGVVDYEAVYLPKNRFLTAESMRTEGYLKLFFPLDALDVVKKG